jgi:hypothetical protein
MTAAVLTAQTALNKHLERRVWAAQVLERQALIRPVPGRRRAATHGKERVEPAGRGNARRTNGWGCGRRLLSTR